MLRQRYQLTSWNRFLLKNLIVVTVSQEIPCLLRSLKVHCHAHKSPPPVPILSQINPIHTLKHNFPKIYFNIIFLFTRLLGLPTSPFPSGISAKIFYTFLISPWFDHNNIWWTVQNIELLILQFSPVTQSLLDPNILLFSWINWSFFNISKAMISTSSWLPDILTRDFLWSLWDSIHANCWYSALM